MESMQPYGFEPKRLLPLA